MSKNQNFTGKQENNSNTSFKGKKPSDRPVGGYGKAFDKQSEQNSRPTGK